MPTIDAQKVIAQLWPTQDAERTIYALVDAARDPQAYTLIKGNSQSRCLYPQDAAAALADVAPYLIPLDRTAEFTRMLITQGWGQSWGTFVESSAAVEELLGHTQELLNVQDENGQSLYFRYYDPRVLRVYLPTCNQDELSSIFGPITSFCAEANPPTSLLRFSKGSAGLQAQEQQLG